MPEYKQQQANGTRDREIYTRLGSLEIDVKSLATQLEAYASHTTDAINQLAQHAQESKDSTNLGVKELRAEFHTWVERFRPNWVGLGGLAIAFAGAIAAIITISTDGKIEPVKRDVAHFEAMMEQTRQAQRREIELRYDLNTVLREKIEHRLDVIEQRLATRVSDVDDRQDAQIERLLKELEDGKQ